MGVEVVDVTLHVGLGTFRPVKVHNLKDHVMHSEEYFMDQKAADSLNLAKKKVEELLLLEQHQQEH